MKFRERIKIVNKDQTVSNAQGKSVAYGYKLKLNESGKPSVRADGVCALESIGGIICGETGYVAGPATQTLFAFLKDGNVGKSSVHNSISGQETTYVIPVFLDRYQKEVYVHTSNIEFI
jgi:hypothetical protein